MVKLIKKAFIAVKKEHNKVMKNENLSLYSYDKSALSLLPERAERSNKSTYGRVLCVCGSKSMSGAAYLCAKAAYRTGAGLVEILTPNENRVILSTLLPEALITTYSSDAPDRSVIAEAKKRADAIVIGCGLGTSLSSKKVLCSILPNTDVPCVIDADALNIIAKDDSLMPLLNGKIITPHPMEMARLMHTDDIVNILDDTAKTAHEFAKTHNCVCVLKTHATTVSDTSIRVYVNNCGNNGMATGGSGDVLAGIIVGILAQMKNTPSQDLTLAATLGVYIHALAGDKAAEAIGVRSLMASDIIDKLCDMLK